MIRPVAKRIFGPMCYRGFARADGTLNESHPIR